MRPISLRARSKQVDGRQEPVANSRSLPQTLLSPASLRRHVTSLLCTTDTGDVGGGLPGCEALRQRGYGHASGVPRFLERYLKSPVENIVRFAAGALSNLSNALQAPPTLSPPQYLDSAPSAEHRGLIFATVAPLGPLVKYTVYKV